MRSPFPMLEITSHEFDSFNVRDLTTGQFILEDVSRADFTLWWTDHALESLNTVIRNTEEKHIVSYLPFLQDDPA